MIDILKIINTVLENKGSETFEALNPDWKLRDDLGFNSFDLAELTVRIEDESGIDIFSDGIIENVAQIQHKLSI